MFIELFWFTAGSLLSPYEDGINYSFFQYIILGSNKKALRVQSMQNEYRA